MPYRRADNGHMTTTQTREGVSAMSNTQRIVKVRINLTLDVDVDSWNLSNGTETVAEVREDVKVYVKNLLQQCAAAEDNTWAVTG